MDERRQALLFSALVLLVSWSYELYIALRGGVGRFGLPALLLLMWIPGLLSVLMRLVLGSGFGDAGLAPGRRRFYLHAVSIPLVLSLLTGALCAVLGIRRFAPVSSADLLQAAPTLVLMIGAGLFGAFGEELGWRGFLLPKMIAGGIPRPYLASGLVWAAWHLPLIVYGGFYSTDRTLLMALAYGSSMVAMTFVISELRVRSGSVWPATVFHASHNFFFQLAVPTLVFALPGERARLWEIVGGDSGFAVALLYALAFLVTSRRLPSRTRGPGDAVPRADTGS